MGGALTAPLLNLNVYNNGNTHQERTNGDSLRVHGNWPQRVSENGYGGSSAGRSDTHDAPDGEYATRDGSSYDALDAGSFPPIEVLTNGTIVT